MNIDLKFLFASVILMALAVLSLYWFGKEFSLTIILGLVGCITWVVYWVIKWKEESK
jgi:hypothetical protein